MCILKIAIAELPSRSIKEAKENCIKNLEVNPHLMTILRPESFKKNNPETYLARWHGMVETSIGLKPI